MTTHVPPEGLRDASAVRRSRAIVIGSGFGGLAAAIRLLARGYAVTIFEKLEQPGGRASVFRQDGFTFDAGPTIVTMPHCFEELFDLCGERMSDHVRLEALDPFYRIRFADGSHIDCFADDDAMRDEVRRISPADLAGYNDFVAESRDLFEYGFEGLGARSFDRLSTMIRELPAMAKRRADRSVYQHVARHVRDERLRMALSFHPLFVGGNPFRATSIYSMITYLERRWGVHYVYGGTGALVQALVGLIKQHGGDIRLNAPVDQLLVEDGKATGVRLETGETHRADLVVSNADALWGYQNLLPAGARKRWSAPRMERVHHSMSLLVWYFGTRCRYDAVGHHTIMMGPRYRGLIDDIFDRKVLAEDFSLYLHRPSATDPTVAPEGYDAFYVLSPVPHLGADVGWQQMAEPYRRKIQAFLEDTILPDLGANLVTSKVMTPLDFRDRLNAPLGAAFGPEPRMLQTAWFRPHNVSEEIGNFYLVGASTHPGAGLPGVVTSAKVLDAVVPPAREWVLADA